MDACPHLANLTVASTSLLWANFSANTLTNTTEASYLRPDTGGALLPWAYTIIIIVLHLPVVVVRVVRWELVQSWCIATAFFTVVLYVQSYVSTGFDPAQILVWTPLLLVIDAGAMAQIFFLIVEAKKRRAADEQRAAGEQRAVHQQREVDRQQAVDRRNTLELDELPRATPEVPNNVQGAEASPESSSLLSRTISADHGKPLPVAQTREIEHREVEAHQRNGSHTPAPPPGPDGPNRRTPRWLRHENYVLVCSAILFVAVVVLQVMGLVAAAKAVLATSAPPDVSWCSPLFQPFGLAVVDRNCHVYAVSEHNKKGIGCILLPGVWQRNWLTGTVAGTSIELVVEVVDLLILGLVNGNRRWREVKMKRPWTSIFAGAVVLFITLDRGIYYAGTPPPGITEQVTVAMDVQGPAAYIGHLMTAGLRGAIIGWSDGLFSSWKEIYLGTETF